LALEYGQAFSLPVIINRCGVMAGGGQFGVADQGIFSYWVRSYAARRPLKYIGFDGTGHQVRDALHPRDLAALLAKQIARATAPVPAAAPASAAPIWNVGGGPDNAMSLVQLSHWCRDRFAEHTVAQSPEPRRWIVMDARKTAAAFDWKPAITLGAILEEIAAHHEKHPNFLDLSAG
jgi:CDP-paratose 2-epimerase